MGKHTEISITVQLPQLCLRIERGEVDYEEATRHLLVVF
jgi:hypothetical protein